MKSKTLNARYPGTCARTGKPFPAGTLIVCGSLGWQIANPDAVTAPPKRKTAPKEPTAAPVQKCTFCDNLTIGNCCATCAEKFAQEED